MIDAGPVLRTNVLALDLGTHTGWALRDCDGKILYGTESFQVRASWSPGQRWQRFRSWLSETIATHQIHVIAYEQVIRHVGTEAAHVYGAFRALVEISADSRNIILRPVGVGTIKMHFTGAGNAKKEAMIAEARRRGYRVAADEDNTADALAILEWALARELNGSIAPAVKKAKPRKKKVAA